MDLGEYQSNLDAFNNAKEQLSNLVDEGRNLIGGKTSIRDKIATVLQQGGDIGGSVLGGLGTIAEISKGTALEKTISSLKDQLTTLRQNVVDGVQKGVESGIDKATTAARNIAGDNPTVNSMIDSASSATRQTLTNATNQAAGGDFTGALNTVKTGGSQALTTGTEAAQSGIKAATDAGTELVQAGTRAASDAVAGATSTVNQTIALAGNAGARATSGITGIVPSVEKLNLRGVGRTLSKRTKAPKQAAKQTKQTEEPTTEQPAVQQTIPNQPTPLGKALGDEDLANIVREQVKAGTVDSDTLNLVKQVEPDLAKQLPTPSTTTPGASAAPAAPEPPALDLPDFPGLSDIPKVNLPDLPGLTDLFGLAPKTTIAAAESAAANIAPKVGSAEAAVAQLGGAMGKLGSNVSGVAKATSDALVQAPSKVLGIANKGMRGDSTIARALRINQSEKPVSVKPTEPARELPQEQMKMPTMEEYEAASKGGFADPSETILSKYLPADRNMGSIGDLESLHIATGIPKEELAAARASEGSSLLSKRPITSSSLDNTAPQARIRAPEPSAEPEGARPQTTTATPNNPTLKPQEPAQPTQAPKPAPKSEIEPAESPAPSTTTTTPSTTTTTPSTTTLPKPAGAAAEGGQIAEEGGTTLGETAIEGGAAIGPEGLLAGALIAGVSSLIGGLIKDFEPSKPSVPTFANTGVSFANQAQISSGTAF